MIISGSSKRRNWKGKLSKIWVVLIIKHFQTLYNKLKLSVPCLRLKVHCFYWWTRRLKSTHCWKIGNTIRWEFNVPATSGICTYSFSISRLVIQSMSYLNHSEPETPQNESRCGAFTYEKTSINVNGYFELWFALPPFHFVVSFSLTNWDNDT